MLTRKATLRRTAMKRTPRKAKSAVYRGHLGCVASLPCLACGAWPVEVHHVHSDGMKRITRSDKLTVPLCPGHHRTGPDAVHTISHAGFTALFGIDLLAEAQRIWRESPANNC